MLPPAVSCLVGRGEASASPGGIRPRHPGRPSGGAEDSSVTLPTSWWSPPHRTQPC